MTLICTPKYLYALRLSRRAARSAESDPINLIRPYLIFTSILLFGVGNVNSFEFIVTL